MQIAGYIKMMISMIRYCTYNQKFKNVFMNYLNHEINFKRNERKISINIIWHKKVHKIAKKQNIVQNENF